MFRKFVPAIALMIVFAAALVIAPAVCCRRQCL